MITAVLERVRYHAEQIIAHQDTNHRHPSTSPQQNRRFERPYPPIYIEDASVHDSGVPCSFAEFPEHCNRGQPQQKQLIQTTNLKKDFDGLASTSFARVPGRRTRDGTKANVEPRRSDITPTLENCIAKLLKRNLVEDINPQCEITFQFAWQQLLLVFLLPLHSIILGLEPYDLLLWRQLCLDSHLQHRQGHHRRGL